MEVSAVLREIETAIQKCGRITETVTPTINS
jgi:hypothetical protein